MTDLTLHDKAYAATYSEPRFKSFQDRLRRARVFVLSDKMSAFMADLAHAAWYDGLTGNPTVAPLKPDGRGSITRVVEFKDVETLERTRTMIDGARKLARAPFDVTWIEFNVAERTKRQNEEYIGNSFTRVAALRSAWLVEALSDEVVRVTIAFEIARDGRVVFSPFSWEYSTESTVPRGIRLLKRQPWDEVEEFEKRVAVSQVGLNFYKSPHVATVTNTLTAEFDHSVIGGFMNEVQGELRYVWTTLSTINDVPTLSHTVTPSRGFMARGKRTAYMKHTVVDIDIPMKKNTRKLARRIVLLSRQRRHEVRGHWKRVGVQKIRKWVESYLKGDAALGWVEKSYSVKRSEEA